MGGGEGVVSCLRGQAHRQGWLGWCVRDAKEAGLSISTQVVFWHACGGLVFSSSEVKMLPPHAHLTLLLNTPCAGRTRRRGKARTCSTPSFPDQALVCSCLRVGCHVTENAAARLLLLSGCCCPAAVLLLLPLLCHLPPLCACCPVVTVTPSPPLRPEGQLLCG